MSDDVADELRERCAQRGDVPDFLLDFLEARDTSGTGCLRVAYRNYNEFARGKPRRTLSSQLSGKLTDSTLSAPCAELAAFWRAGLAEFTVAFAKRSLSSRFVDTFTTPPLIVHWAGARSISAELTLVSESGRSLKGIRDSGPGCLSSAHAQVRVLPTDAR